MSANTLWTSTAATDKLLTGRAFSDEKLIAYACAFEAATQVRNKGPKPNLVSVAFVPTA